MKQVFLNSWQKNWNVVVVNDTSKANYGVRNKITYNTKVLKSNLCDYNDAYILVRDDTTFTGAGATQIVIKKYAPFTKCITKIHGTAIDDPENLDLVMPNCNLIEYSLSYSETKESLWLYSKVEATNRKHWRL